jgi:hypothetical protein
MKMHSQALCIILGSELRADPIAVRINEPWKIVAERLEKRLRDFDLRDPKKFRLTFLFQDVNFSFLLPGKSNGEFEELLSWVGVYERKLEGLDELSFDSPDCYGTLIARIGRVLTQRLDQADERDSLAA